MKKGNGIWWIVGGLAVLGVGYFAFKKFTKKGEQKAEEIKSAGQEAPVDKPAELPTETGNPFANIANALTNFLTNYQDYEVATQTSSLNVRQKPDAQSRIVGSLKKGSTVRAKASGVKGWFAISDNDKDIKGYVSQTYLKAKKKP